MYCNDIINVLSYVQGGDYVSKRGFHLGLPDDLRENLRSKAEEKGISIAGLIRMILKECLHQN